MTKQPIEHTNAAGALLITDMRCALPAEAWTDAGATVDDPQPCAEPSGKWQALRYRSALYEGWMLRAVFPDAAPLRIPLGRSGWHAVSIGLAHATGGETFVEARLTGEPEWHVLQDFFYLMDRTLTTRGRVYEDPWMLADLTGRDLEIRYPAGDGLNPAGGGHCAVYAVRAVPLRPADVPAAGNRHRRMVLFADENPPFYSERYDHAGWDVVCFNNSATDAVTYRTAVGQPVGLDAWALPPGSYWASQFLVNARAALARGEDHLQQGIDRAHKTGKRFWMGIRPQAWVTTPPMDHVWRSRFYSAHPQYRCRQPDGAALSTLSVAFPAVRAQFGALLEEGLDRGADGVTLLFSRGSALVRYEDPVRERFRVLYGGEAREAPESDPRLHRVWAEFMTQWLRELRSLLDAKGPTQLAKRRELTVMTGPSLPWNLQFGIDVEAWAREGLVDVIMPYPRHRHTDRLYSKPDGREDGWLDIEAYVQALAGTAVELIPSLGDWMHPESLATLRRRAHDYYQAGATGLCRWDNEVCMARAGLDDPEIQRIWRAYWPPQDNPLIEIGGLRVDAFSPGTGFD